MATGLVTLGSAALSAGGQAASAPGAPAYTAPQNQENQVSFGGARKETIGTKSAIILGVGIFAAVIVYVATRK